VECVARGYLVGSGWKDYQQTGAVCGHPLPPGLLLCGELQEVLFTPATKAVQGHDENIDFTRMQSIVGATAAAELRQRTLEIYCRARDYARERGIIIADTKLEWGHRNGEILLVDEVLTPDSSRFWPADQYRPGKNQPSYDKQIVRDYLETLPWDKRPPAPTLPEAIVQQTSEKYLEIYTRLTGKSLREA
jgi:phosphoribosylaminoimidazole-succinocarboxamide synthase